MSLLGTIEGKIQKQTPEQRQSLINGMPGQVSPQFGTETAPQMNQLPMYAQGGDVPKDQVAHVDAGERVLNPEEAHAYHSAAAGEAPPTLLGRIADRAHEIYNQGAALISPMNSEADALKEKQQNVNTAQRQMATENKPLGTINYAPVAADQVHPGAAYGNRSGEQRIDTSSMMKPLGAAPAVAKLPSYDEGGDVPEDQTAQLGEGEHVLDPDKAAAYRQAEAEIKGAPADFGGQVLANPKGIKPQSDTDRSMAEPQRLTGGAKMKTDLAPLGNTKMDKENTPITQIDSGVMSDASARTPLGNTGAPQPTQMKSLPHIETPLQSGATDNPNAPQGEVAQNEASAEAAGAKVQHQAPNPEHAAIIQKDKEDAAQRGDLVGLGKAMINERLFAPKKEPAGPDLVPPSAPQLPEYTGTQKAMNTENHAELQAKRKDYDKRIQVALDSGTPQGREEAASLQLARQHFDKMNPYGSAANHPGVLGKIEHGLAKAGNIAGNIVAPGTMSLIPGTELNKQAQRSKAEGEIGQAEEGRLKSAQATVEEGKPELQQEQQRISEEKNQMANEANLRKSGYKLDQSSGLPVPLPYEEMSAHEQGVYDLNQAKGNAQNAIAELKQAQADPDSPQSKLILAKAEAEGKKIDMAGQKLGLDVDKYKADYLGVDHDNKPLPGATLTPEGKAIGPKMMPKGAGKPTANQSMKADLAENVVKNIDEATKLIRNNPGLFGKISGRFTTTAQMIGSDDKAISQLGLIIHNTALATNGIHGLRSAQAIEGTEKELLNKFKNSPEATIAALKENRRSVGDFMKDGGKPLIADPDLVPAGASAEVRDKNGDVVGHVVNNKYVALPKE